jgi:hypothetical protein
MPDKTIAASLQRQADQNAQAQERIDADPEEAAAVLERHVTADGGITVADMFGLFKQLAGQQAAMQQQIVSLMQQQGQRGQPRSQADTHEELERAALQQKMTLQAWADEPKRPVWVPATIDELNMYKVHGEYPPRSFYINGLTFPVKVNQVVNVPESVALMIEWTQGVAVMDKSPQDLSRISDPERGQFLAGSQSISAGYPGRSGEGQLVTTSPGTPQPLDVRYDHLGR